MSLLARFKLWRDRRALDNIRMYASLVVSPSFIKGMSDDELTSFLLRTERARARAAKGSMRTLSTMAYDFQATWEAMIDVLAPDEVERRIQEYAESLREDAADTL